MTARRLRTVVITAAALAALLPSGVGAEDAGNDRNTVQVGPNTQGQVIVQGSAGYNPNGIQATAASSPAAAPTVIQSPDGNSYRPVPYNASCGSTSYSISNNGTITVSPCFMQSACPPGQTGYYAYDSQGTSLGIVCIPAPTNFPPATSPEIALAEQASSEQPWPTLRLGVNPAVGLTGLPSWFWLTGGAPQMRDATASAGPLTVTVRATFEGVSWVFGDGLGYDSSDLGRAYPAQSDIQHVYQTDTYKLASGYTVSGILRYLVTYRVNGGAWQQLGIKTTAFSLQYFVYQLQPAAVPTT